MHPKFDITPKSDEKLGLLLVVSSNSEDDGINGVDLIQTCCNIIGPHNQRKEYGTTAFPLSENEEENESIFKNIFKTTGYFEQFTDCDHLPIALELAINSWSKKSFVYAIHKLMLSYSLDRATWWSMHLGHGQVFEKYSNKLSYHVSASYAINAAFSAIEELGLEVRSSSKKPRFKDNSAGIWNDEVLKDIIQRLNEEGIDSNKEIDWIKRGDISLAEEEIKPQYQNLSHYADGSVVRDLTIALPDALHYCSYLRNYMTAHRFRDATSKIGAYEVFNVQSVARFLILSMGKCWNLDLNALAKRHTVVSCY